MDYRNIFFVFWQRTNRRLLGSLLYSGIGDALGRKIAPLHSSRYDDWMIDQIRAHLLCLAVSCCVLRRFEGSVNCECQPPPRVAGTEQKKKTQKYRPSVFHIITAFLSCFPHFKRTPCYYYSLYLVHIYILLVRLPSPVS